MLVLVVLFIFQLKVNSLIEELSMINSNNYVKELSNSSREPYRAVLRDVRLQLKNTIDNIENQLDGREPIYTNVIKNQKDFDSIEIAGPGFLNLKFTNKTLILNINNYGCTKT